MIVRYPGRVLRQQSPQPSQVNWGAVLKTATAVVTLFVGIKTLMDR
jgi:hypothetical protein